PSRAARGSKARTCAACSPNSPASTRPAGTYAFATPKRKTAGSRSPRMAARTSSRAGSSSLRRRRCETGEKSDQILPSHGSNTDETQKSKEGTEQLRLFRSVFHPCFICGESCLSSPVVDRRGLQQWREHLCCGSKSAAGHHDQKRRRNG